MSVEQQTEFPLPLDDATEHSIWGSLGWLRFALAVIVASSHLRAFYANYVTTWDPARVLGSFGGMAAVLGFLLVSGFSVCHSLVQQPNDYLRRRFLRIYPLYLIAIAFSVWVGGYWVPTGGGTGLEPREFPGSSYFQILMNTMLLQGALAEPLFNNGPLWTLSLEWWLYMLAPLIVGMKPKHLTWLLVLLALGHLSWIVAAKYLNYYHHTLAFANLWFLGVFWVLGFWFYLNKRQISIAPLVIILGVWFLTGLNRESLGGNSQVTLLFSCLILIYGGKIPLPRWLSSLGQLMGNVSYPLYLIHLPIFHLFNRHEPLRQAWLMLILAIVASLAIHMFVEKPLRILLSMIWRKPIRGGKQPTNLPRPS